MFPFLTAVFLLVCTPGPGVLSTAGVGAAFGFRAGFRYVTGLWLGNNLVGLIVVSGYAAILFAIPWVRTVLLVLSSAYLFYLAGRIAFAGSKIAFIAAREKPGVRAGLLLQLINPKAYVVNTTLFTGFNFVPESLWTEVVIKFIIMNIVWIPVHLLWLKAGSLVQQMNLSPRSQMTINGIMALAMLTVVVLALLSL